VEALPKVKRKRQRSATPSEPGRNYNPGKDAPTSPLSKRRKVVAERSGYSKLKHTISAADLSRVDEDRDEDRDHLSGGTTAPLTTREEEMDDGDNEESSWDEDDDDDDFLAREMEEEWG
jgi:RNA polymerase II subunit A C-terminal domain phosphatase